MRKKITSKKVLSPLSKLFVTPPFSLSFRSQIENHVSDYILKSLVKSECYN